MDSVGREDGHSSGFHGRLHQVSRIQLSHETIQTAGMLRLEALSASTVGSRNLWMGETHVAPLTGSGVHHHGKSETGIYVLSGQPAFVFFDGRSAARLEASPGDYIYIPPWVAHQELNPRETEEAVVVIARSTQRAIVVNLDDTTWQDALTVPWATASAIPAEEPES